VSIGAGPIGSQFVDESESSSVTETTSSARSRPARIECRSTGLGAVVLMVVAAGCASGVRLEASAEAAGHEAHHALADPAAPIGRVEFRQDMRRLWEDHITWTRLFIVSAVAGLPDVDPTAGRLLQNQADIGAAIAPFYGEEAGATLTGLLREHILIAADLVAAAKAGDGGAVAKQRHLWYANANEIADFLAAANPAWTKQELREMMREHLDQTLAEATARINGDWAADIAAYDRIHVHILAMADVLVAGIIEQFPNRFGR
jgi:hypothetical protein